MTLFPGITKFLHGGDYSPEQWPARQWLEDIGKMPEARADTLTLGIFAWSALEPADGVYELDWLGEVLDALAARGLHAILATPSAAQPAWMSLAHPEILRAPEGGKRNRHGMRMNFCISSAHYRRKCADINQALAIRFGSHPALIAWHISNEFSQPCFCPACEDAFRAWLRRRYGSLDELNRRWSTAFWSHTYSAWEQIEAPGADGEMSCEALWINWKRFASDQFASFIRNEAGPLRKHSPRIPITTNLMGTHEPIDYWRLAAELDFVSMDAYPAFDARTEMVDAGIEHSFVYDLMRSFKRDRPWILMETTPSSANWMPFMKLKRPGVHRLAALQSIAHGSDAVLYFQWRQGLGGREKFHGAVLDHTGSTETRVFAETADVGQVLERIDFLQGSVPVSDVAVIYDWEVRWAIGASCGPARDHKDYLPTCLAHYRPLWERGISADVIQSTEDFTPYRLLIAPMLYLLRPGVAERLEIFVREGGILVGTYWSGMADEDDRLFSTPFPGPLRGIFGLENEETDILYPDESVPVAAVEGNALGLDGPWSARIFCAQIRSRGAEVLARYDGEFYAGSPALTRHACGSGAAYYVGFRSGPEFLDEFYEKLCAPLDLPRAAPIDLPAGVTARVRSVPGTTVLFLLNFTAERREVPWALAGSADALTGEALGPAIEIPAHGCRVLRWPSEA